MSESMNKVCKERYLLWKQKGHSFPICGDCIYDKNLNGHYGDCDFVFEKSNHMLPRELNNYTIDLLLNSTSKIERINYLKKINGGK